MTYKLALIKLIVSLLLLLCTECVHLHIKPTENSFVSSNAGDGSTGMLDIGGMTNMDLQAIDTLSIQLYNKDKPMHFSISNDINKDSFIHGTDETGCTINLISKYDPADGTQIIAGSIVDYENKVIHQIRQNIVISGSPSSVKEFRDAARSDNARPADEVEDDNIKTSAKSSIDIMILWTKRAECEYSSLKSNCDVTSNTKKQMEILSELAVAETNVAFQNSGVDVELNIVYANRVDNSYKETNKDTPQVLRDLAKVDGVIDDIHSIRDDVGADMVSMLIGETADGYGGYAYYTPTQKDYMFSVVLAKYASGYYLFAHELGHNFGCYHDRGSEEECEIYSEWFAYGYRNPNAEFRDIMAYNCASGQCDKNKGGGCPKAQMFSNKVKKYNGKKIGDKNNDCARMIESTRAIIANFYESVTVKKPAKKKGKKKKKKKGKKKKKRKKKKSKKKKNSAE